MFALSPTSVPAGATIENPDIRFSDYLSAVWSSGRRNSAQGMYQEWLDTSDLEKSAIDNNEKLLTPDEANKLYGAHGLVFKAPVYPSVAGVRREQHMRLFTESARLSSEPTLEVAGVPTFIPKTFKGAAGLALGMLSGLTRPLDFGLMFVPFVGGEIKLAQAAGSVGRFSVARQAAARAFERGLIPRSAIPLASRLPTVAPAVANNLFQQIVAETPVVMRELQRDQDVDASRLVQSMLLGGFASESIRGLFHLLSKLGPEFHTATFNRAVDDLASGREVDTTPEVILHTTKEHMESSLAKSVEARLDPELAKSVDNLVRTVEENSTGVHRDIHSEKIQAEADRLNKAITEREESVSFYEAKLRKNHTGFATNLANRQMGARFRAKVLEEVVERISASEKHVASGSRSMVLQIAEDLASSKFKGQFRYEIQRRLDRIKSDMASGKLNHDRLKELGDLIGLRVIKERPLTTDQLELLSKVGSAVDQEVDRIARLRPEVVARAELISEEIFRITETRRKALIEDNRRRIVENARSKLTSSSAQLAKLRQELEALPELKQRAEKVAKESITYEVSELKALNSELLDSIKSELSEADLAEVSSMKFEDMDEAQFTKIVNESANCILKNASP